MADVEPIHMVELAALEDRAHSLNIRTSQLRLGQMANRQLRPLY